MIASGIGMATSKVMYFGSGGEEGITHRMEFGAGLRNLFLVAAWVMLLIAIHRRPRREGEQR